MIHHHSWPQCLEPTNSEQKLQFTNLGFLLRPAMEFSDQNRDQDHQNMTQSQPLNPDHRIPANPSHLQANQAIDQQAMAGRVSIYGFMYQANGTNSLFSSRHQLDIKAIADSHSNWTFDLRHVTLISNDERKVVFELQFIHEKQDEDLMYQSFRQQQQDQLLDLSSIQPRQHHDIIHNNEESNHSHVLSNQNSQGQGRRQDREEKRAENNDDTYQFIPPPEAYNGRNLTFQQIQTSLQNNTLEVSKSQEEEQKLYEEFYADQLSQRANGQYSPQSVLAESNYK